MRKTLIPLALIAAAPSAAALAQASAAIASGKAQPSPLAPSEIVAAAPKADWTGIAASDLLVMDLASDAKGRPRRVVIQLMPPPFSQGWIGNVRKLAAAKFWDGTSVNRVQDNYVVQWGDATEKKPLPKGLVAVSESEYQVDGEALGSATFESVGSDSSIADDATASASEAASAAMEAAFDWRERDRIAQISIDATKTPTANAGWHQRDSFSQWVELWKGWPLANHQGWHWEDYDGNRVEKPAGVLDEANTDRIRIVGKDFSRIIDENKFWPIHCYGMVGVGRDLPPNTGSGAELYTVIGHAPRHLDRNIALVGRVIEGIEHLSSLPRGHGALGFYDLAQGDERVPIVSVRIGNEVKDLPQYEYLSTESESFARYADARANRRDAFFIRPAGGADVCNIPVPVRRVK